MNHDLLAAAQRRATRTTPFGGPWWIYALCIGGANIARQLLLPDDVDTWIQVTTFAATVLVVGALVAGFFRWRRTT